MERNDSDKRLDEWLDQATAEFGKAEIRPGFHERIVAGIQARKALRKRIFFLQALAASAIVVVAVLLSVLSLSMIENEKSRVVSKSVEKSPDVLDQDSIGPFSSVGDIHEPAANPGKAVEALPEKKVEVEQNPDMEQRLRMENDEFVQESLPRRDVFPSAELSEQEYRLLAYARALSSIDTAGLEEYDEELPISIPELEIPRLEIPRMETAKLEIESIRIEPLMF